MLEEFGFLSRCVFTSFDAAIIDYLHDAYQLKTQGFPAELMSNFDSGIEGTFSKMWAVGISTKLLTSPLVERFREMGILTWCYCPDDDQQVYEALAHGITLMTCNDPRPAMRIRLQAEAEAQAQALE
jgi:glycerophosphoryl diester phosphodiesterase